MFSVVEIVNLNMAPDARAVEDKAIILVIPEYSGAEVYLLGNIKCLMFAGGA